MDIYKSDKIFTKKIQFNKFFTKTVKDNLLSNKKISDKIRYNFHVEQEVSVKTKNGVSTGIRPFPMKLDVSVTSAYVTIGKPEKDEDGGNVVYLTPGDIQDDISTKICPQIKGVGAQLNGAVIKFAEKYYENNTPVPSESEILDYKYTFEEQNDELPPDTFIEHFIKEYGIKNRKELTEIDVYIHVIIDDENYTPMNDPESLKLARELEGKEPKQSKSQSKNELHEIADKISKEGVDPEIVSKIVEIVLATLPIVMKK